MASKQEEFLEEVSSKSQGIIPDFFHDVIAYIVPGYVAILLVAFNAFLFSPDLDFEGIGTLAELAKLSWTVVISAGIIFTIVAYVVGRFFEQLGYVVLHKSRCVGKPKWDLIFSGTPFYTEAFQENVREKIEKWLEKQDGEELVKECKKDRKDDYFNLIKFYLNERFPSFALYDKKQNASIESTRSLSLIFSINAAVVLIFAVSPDINQFNMLVSWTSVFVSILFGWVFFCRFERDRRYHAMYIFEVFIATKKLLRRRNRSPDNKSVM